jgi:phosphonopyruvate decarboxylase
MIQPFHFLQQLTQAGISFFTGVPDSLLKGLITAIERSEKETHFIAANEGAALGLAAGYHLATGGLPVVYLQNSGLGNLINPLTSLTDKAMYGIPALLIVGWRGEPGVEDEPQHKVMGEITPSLLHQLHVPFIVIKKGDDHEWRESLVEAIEVCQKEKRPVALLVESGVFPEDELGINNEYELTAAEVVEAVYNKLKPDDIVICTTGKIGRTFYQLNSEQNKISRYFLSVGSMGHALSIATGLALYRRERVFVLDGDGALLMHMGALTLPATLRLNNLHYILINNGAHQSVGAQPTLGFQVDFAAIAKGCGFQAPLTVHRKESLLSSMERLQDTYFLEVRVNTQTGESLPRPSTTPKEAKEAFMTALGIATKKES